MASDCPRRPPGQGPGLGCESAEGDLRQNPSLSLSANASRTRPEKGRRGAGARILESEGFLTPKATFLLRNLPTRGGEVPHVSKHLLGYERFLSAKPRLSSALSWFRHSQNPPGIATVIRAVPRATQPVVARTSLLRFVAPLLCGPANVALVSASVKLGLHSH